MVEIRSEGRSVGRAMTWNGLDGGRGWGGRAAQAPAE